MKIVIEYTGSGEKLDLISIDMIDEKSVVTAEKDVVTDIYYSKIEDLTEAFVLAVQEELERIQIEYEMNQDDERRDREAEDHRDYDRDDDSYRYEDDKYYDDDC